MVASSATHAPSYGERTGRPHPLGIGAHASLSGGRLPTERQLAAQLGVTRTMVRHALAVLEAEGRISREVGRGTFLRHRFPGAPRPAAIGTRRGPTTSGPADVMAARRLIEPQVLPLVVAWATTRDFDEMRRCLDGGAAGGQR